MIRGQPNGQTRQGLFVLDERNGLLATVVNTIGQGEAGCGLGERMRVLKSGAVERAGF